MKRIALLCLALALCLALVACGAPTATTAPGSAPSVAVTSANASVAAALPSQPFVELLQGNHYTLEYTAEAPTTTTEGEPTAITYRQVVDGDMSATTTQASGYTSRVILREGKGYSIDDAAKQVIVMDLSGLPSAPDYSTLTYVTSGEADGMAYDEYSYSSMGINTTMRFFVSDGALVRIDSIAGDLSTSMQSVVLSAEVPADAFEIPADYMVQEITTGTAAPRATAQAQ